MSTFIRRYSMYLTKKAHVYADSGYDFCRIPRGYVIYIYFTIVFSCCRSFLLEPFSTIYDRMRYISINYVTLLQPYVLFVLSTISQGKQIMVLTLSILMRKANCKFLNWPIFLTLH